jgi:biopolymer transport protein ExbD
MGMARLKYLERRFRPSEASRRRIAKRQSKYYCWMDVSGLLAVALALVVIYMLIPGVTRPYHRIPIDWIASRHSRRLPLAIREDALRVLVMRDGKMYFGREVINPSELPERLRDGVRAGAEDRVYLMVDSRTKYGDVKPALTEISLSGVRNVSFLTSPFRSQQAGSPSVATDPSEYEGGSW